MNIPDENDTIPAAPGPRPLKTRIDELAAALGPEADSVVIIVTEQAGTATHIHNAFAGNMYAAGASVEYLAKKFASTP